MKRTHTALVALMLAFPGSAYATPDEDQTAQASLVLIGDHPSSALLSDIENQSRINTILSNMCKTNLGDIDQQADQDIADGIAKALEERPATSDFLTKRDNAALEAFYEERNFAPAWFDNGQWTRAARKLIFALARADRDGLNPADYKTPLLTTSRKRGSSPEDIARADILLSLAVTRYTRDAFAGRVDPRIFSKKEVTIKPHYPDSIAALSKLTISADPVADMRSYNPPHKGFLALRNEYNHIRALGSREKTTPIPNGKSLKIGMRDERVPLIRERIGLEPEQNTEDANLYSKSLAEKVKDFQLTNGLIADGIVGNATLSIMNRGSDHKKLLADMIANMERWRWLPRDLGEMYVMVNIPTFSLDVVDKGKVIHQTRVVVGKSAHKTPLFSDQMEYLVVNPYWNVPKSIASNELLPKIKTNPASFFANTNYQVLASVEGKTKIIDPSLLDWDKVEPGMVRLRQTPGTSNALGNIKFMFPNQHSVYLHDTPSRSLFNRDYRAFSHGCVRVHNPFELAEVVLSQTANWNADRVKKLLGKEERTVRLDKKIPVHLVYFTTWMSEDGQLLLRNDLYGHNNTVKKALNL
ncbi:L,D-transpeptidase family protein [uncultured Cohaesibacter sp.]|uniref:L,D-transpeptidase family protein n=1 Tax=uncultured Cohaesibacter sp. TaxID=1002546 RepID=UPI00292F5FF8|nr:L,D-transpeptidase family protein [uncultured Cohaesibacter sp.]